MDIHTPLDYYRGKFCVILWLGKINMAANSRIILFLSLGLSALGPMTASAQTNPTDEAALDFFEKKVRPVLVSNCYNCHSANTNSKGGLRVDDRNGLVF